jgi:hypothetical protein
MSATQTVFDSYSHPHSAEFSDSMLAFPSFGTVIARIKGALANWAQASIEEQTDASLWKSAAPDARVQAEMARASQGSEQGVVAPVVALPRVSDRQPLNEDWGRIIMQGYQTRYHSSGAQHA